MTRYIAIIDQNEEGQYGAWFPDADGCTAMGATEEEVIANATETLAEWVDDVKADGQEVPRPRTYAELLKSNIDYGLGKGGMIATIPLISLEGKSVRANISIDAGLLSLIDDEAKRRGMSRSAFLAVAVQEKVRASA